MRLGEQVARRAFELDAARTDVDLGIGATWHGMETTSFDGTTAELFNNDALADAFGLPTGGTKPKVLARDYTITITPSNLPKWD